MLYTPKDPNMCLKVYDFVTIWKLTDVAMYQQYWVNLEINILLVHCTGSAPPNIFFSSLPTCQVNFIGWQTK